MIDSTVFGSMVGYGFIGFAETTKGSKVRRVSRSLFLYLSSPLWENIRQPGLNFYKDV